MTALYNEIDPFAAQWLRELIKAGHIAPGDVAECSIEDLKPDDIRRYTQVHLFAGIGVWSYALRRAGWPDDRPVWTMSCPCQPFSAAGKGAGFADERHLWPAGYHLIRECRPSDILGEQVEGKDGLAWLDLVQADLEGVAYACGAVVAPSAGFGAPHGRHRQYWAAHDMEHAAGDGRLERRAEPGWWGAAGGRGAGELADNNNSKGLEGRREPGRERAAERLAGAGGVVGFVEYADMPGENGRAPGREQPLRQQRDKAVSTGDASPVNGFWRAADWLFCRDEHWRPVEPGTFPLANGIAARMEQLRGYGNAINAEQAAAFIEAYIETRSGT